MTIALVVVAVGAVTTAAIGLGDGGAPGTSADATPTVTTEPITRTNLTQTQQVHGVIGYGSPVTVSSRGPGTITWLPAPGATIGRGKALYKMDNRSVSLFFGALPLYRVLRAGDTGEDVLEVERNLAALGYRGITIDRAYTKSTSDAVRRWQKDRGLPQTGIFDPAYVVMALAPVRVVTLTAHLGDQAGGPVLAYAGTQRKVYIALDVGLQSLAKVGAPAEVTLPDGSTTQGTLATVGTVATAGEDEHHPATIDVSVTLADQAKLGTLDQAPVVVRLRSAIVENVLTVPVAALVALAEGGYGVQVVTGTSSHYVAVQLGMFGNGRVQITGEGLAEGILVGVPS